jgi:hypothetical protein
MAVGHHFRVEGKDFLSKKKGIGNEIGEGEKVDHHHHHHQRFSSSSYWILTNNNNNNTHSSCCFKRSATIIPIGQRVVVR